MIRVVKTERDYEYDENWQLTKCTEIEENKGTTTYVYQYDAVGKRTSYAKTTYEYDKDGNLISESTGNKGVLDDKRTRVILARS